jgi:hypothetical protein
MSRSLAHIHHERGPETRRARSGNERLSATFAKIAKPSRSGSFDISNPETIGFDNFYFQLVSVSIAVVAATIRGAAQEDRDD